MFSAESNIFIPNLQAKSSSLLYASIWICTKLALKKPFSFHRKKRKRSTGQILLYYFRKCQFCHIYGPDRCFSLWCPSLPYFLSFYTIYYKLLWSHSRSIYILPQIVLTENRILL